MIVDVQRDLRFVNIAIVRDRYIISQKGSRFEKTLQDAYLGYSSNSSIFIILLLMRIFQNLLHQMHECLSQQIYRCYKSLS
jgi:hypothetical protein